MICCGLAFQVGSADSGTLSDTAVPGVPDFFRDSSVKDTEVIDSLHEIAPLRLLRNPARGNALPRRIRFRLSLHLPVDTMPPRPMPKISGSGCYRNPASVALPRSYDGTAFAGNKDAELLSTIVIGAARTRREKASAAGKKEAPAAARVASFSSGCGCFGSSRANMSRNVREGISCEEIKKLAGKGIELADPDKIPGFMPGNQPVHHRRHQRVRGNPGY